MARLSKLLACVLVLGTAACACKGADQAAASAAPPHPPAPVSAADEPDEPEPPADDETDGEEGEALFAKAVAAEHAGKLGEAARWFEEACGAGLGTACERLGEMYSDGRGVRPDDRRAHELFEQGCALGSTQACDEVGH